MDVESTEAEQNDSGVKAAAAGEEMDVDAKSSSTRSQKAGRVQKRNRKPRNSIVFKAKTYSKDKKGPKRK